MRPGTRTKPTGGKKLRQRLTPASGVPDKERRSGVSGALLAVCALVSVLVALDYSSNAGKIYQGVEVGAVSLGGKTPDEAERLLKDRTMGEIGAIELAGRGGVSLTPEELGADYDVADTVRNAYDVGREGGLLERLSERLGTYLGGTSVPLEVDYRTEEVRDRVRLAASRLEEEPREAAVEVRGSEVEAVPASEGYSPDVEATLASVEEAIRNPGNEARLVGEALESEVTTQEAEEEAAKARRAMSGPLTLRSGGEEWTISPEEISTALDVSREDGAIEVSLRKGGLGEYMGDMYEELNVEPKEAGYSMVEDGEFSVTPGESGSRVEDQKFFDLLADGIFTGRRAYEVPVVEERPELTTVEARAQKPTAMLGSFQTNYLTYDDSPGRVDNLETASNAVDDTTLAPGEVFSFNELAAPLDYAETKVIVDGRVDTAEGGGLCQVSSTLYMAANLAGLEEVERQPHYAELPYIQPGFDATVWFGAIDMKFENTNDSPVYVREWVDRGTGEVNAQIWGRPDGKEVEMSSKKVDEYEDDKGNPVTEWVTYKTVSEDGEVVESGPIHSDTYKYLKPAAEDAPSADRPPN